jgi:hypothetical protein
MAQEGEYCSTNELWHGTYYFLAQIEAVISPAIANAPFFRPTPVFLQFAGCLVGPEPLRVSFECNLQF